MQGPFADIDFLYEVGDLRAIKRRFFYGNQPASVAEHTLRVAYIALILARKTEGADIAKTLQIGLMHDVAEVRTGDQNPWQKPFVKTDEEAALADMLEGTALEDLQSLLEAYGRREGVEAEIVKDADMIDTELELREMKAIGCQNMEFFDKTGVRDDVASRLRTEAGRNLMKLVRQRSPFDRALVQQSSIKNKSHGK